MASHHVWRRRSISSGEPLRALLAPDALDRARLVRPIFELERLEARCLLTIVPIDATAGVPFDGLVATDLRLPAHATGLELINVMINGQWDYTPTAVAKEDGTFDLYVRMTPQRAGTDEMTIWFRNDITGGWDILERGGQTVKANHFSAEVADDNIYNVLPGTRYRDAIATFSTSSLTQSLENYEADVNWFGETIAGRLVRENNGTVGVYLDEAYLPLTADSKISVTIRLADTAAPVGHAEASLYVYASIGFGMFYGYMSSETEFRIILPNEPVYEGVHFHYFVPVAELEGWETSFSAEVTWQYRDHEVGKAEAQVVRHPDGSYRLVGQWPSDFDVDNAMMRICETVERPAVDGQPAATYTIEYVGSFWLGAEPDPPIPQEPTTPAEPTPVGGSMRGEIFIGFAEKREGEFVAVSSAIFDNADSDFFATDDADDDILVE